MIELSTIPDVIITIIVGLILAKYVGDYMANVFLGRPSLLDAVMMPVESFLYRFMGIDPDHQMRWQEYAATLLVLNAALIAFVFLILLYQGSLPYNALGAQDMNWTLAFHTASAFMTNTDFQHYTPENGASLFASLFGLQLLMFMSAATGIAVLAAFTRGFIHKSGRIGNFWVDLIKANTRVLLPLSLIAACLFILFSVPQTLAQSVKILPLTGGPPETIPIGPVATWDAIELIGTNGAGFYAANLANPLQNPTAITNLMAILLMFLIPFGAIFMFGKMVKKQGEAHMLLATVLVIFLIGVALFVFFESADPYLASTNVAQGAGGYMTGLETRFSLPESSLFQVTSVFTNTGTNDLAIGSITPGAQMVLFWGMFLQMAPGGDGTGLGVLLITVVLSIFIGGLLVGRTPEYLGKKIGKGEMRWAAVMILSHPFMILIPLGLAFVFGFAQAAGSGPYTFSGILYEFTSESANNGSAIGGFNDNTYFFNLMGAAIMLVGRYLPILAMLAIGGSLAGGDKLPPGPGTIKTDSMTFTIYLILFITIVTGLLFLPVLVMGPFAQGGLGGW